MNEFELLKNLSDFMNGEVSDNGFGPFAEIGEFTVDFDIGGFGTDWNVWRNGELELVAEDPGEVINFITNSN